MRFSIAPSIETQNIFFEREIRLFPLRRIVIRFLEGLYNRYLNRLINLLDESYTDIQGALVVLKDYSQEDAQRDLPSVKKAIKLIITYKTHLERVEYLDSEEVKTKIALVISALYDAEIQLKKKAFAGQVRSSTQPELIEAIASASKEALSSALSH